MADVMGLTAREPYHSSISLMGEEKSYVCIISLRGFQTGHWNTCRLPKDRTLWNSQFLLRTYPSPWIHWSGWRYLSSTSAKFPSPSPTRGNWFGGRRLNPALWTPYRIRNTLSNKWACRWIHPESHNRSTLSCLTCERAEPCWKPWVPSYEDQEFREP